MTEIELTGEETSRRLRVIGARLKRVDRMLLAVVAMRMELSGRVAWTKSRRRDADHPNGEPISRPEVETQRLDETALVAPEYRLDPNFARALHTFLIDHGCKLQMIHMQNGRYDYGEFTLEELRANLLELTRLVAPVYGHYDQRYPATHMYRQFELEKVELEIGRLSERGCCLDLGCGGGGLTHHLVGQGFDQVVGVDISPEMITVARDRMRGDAEFVVADLELPEFWESLPDASCDFVVMGLGTASTIPNIGFVMKQIDRVLRPRGRFFLSFYNSEGLSHQLGFQPWTSSLAAVVDSERSCVDVHTDERILSVYARAYSENEVNDLLGPHSHLSDSYSYPALASILPREGLEDLAFRAHISAIDEQLSSGSLMEGAYLVVTGGR